MVKHGGIGTYLRSILNHLDQITPLEFDAPIYSLKEQWELSRRVPECDLFWSPHFNVPLFPIRAKKRVVTIHDVYHLDHLDQFSPLKRLYAKSVIGRAIKTADQVITISHFSKSRLLRYFPEIEHKIRVIHSGCDHLLSVKPEPVQVTKPFFLFVSNIKPHKNLPLLLEMMKGCKSHQLVVVGKGEYGLGPVTEGQLVWLYQNADALLFPSFYEGWGLPPLEAMSLGCPVLASHAASIPEACGAAALYYSPYDLGELQKCINELPARRKELIERGLERASIFTWKKCADQHLNSFTNTP